MATYSEQYNKQIADPTQGGYTIGGQAVNVGTQPVDVSQPSPKPEGLTRVATQGVGPDGKPIYDVFAGQEHIADPNDTRLKGVDIAGLPTGQAPTGFQSKFGIAPSNYEKGFNNAKTSGTTSPSSTSKALSVVDQYAPSTRNNTASAFIQSDPFVDGLVKTWQDYINPANQRKSLTDTYNQMLKDSGVQGIDTELLDTKRIIEGTEDDIRAEVTASGGVATESQVQALANSRNKQLIKNYNQLIDLRNSKEKYLQTSLGLEQADRASADQRFESMFQMGTQLQQIQQQMKKSSIESLDRTISTLGWSGLANVVSPYEASLIEQAYGLPQGGLIQAAQQEMQLKAQAEQERQLGLQEKQLGLQEKQAGIQLKGEQVKTQQAQQAKIAADMKKTGVTTPAQSPYQVQQSQRITTSVDELLPKVNNYTSGLLGKTSSYIPGTQAYNFRAQLETLKANIAFGALTQMREASKTGGALGQISDAEERLLSATLGALDMGQSQEQLKKQLNKIKDSITRWNNAVGDAGLQVAPDGSNDLIQFTD